MKKCSLEKAGSIMDLSVLDRGEGLIPNEDRQISGCLFTVDGAFDNVWQ
jgi:hypothetical protein